MSDKLAELQDWARRIAAAQGLAVELLQPHIPAIREVLERMQRYTDEIYASTEKFGPLSLTFIQAVNEAPEVNRSAHTTLAGHGWFMEEGMVVDELIGPAESIAAGNITNADSELQGFFDSQLDRIEQTLINRNPTRERFLRSAFAAHRRADFAAAIPLFLAQADGICYDFCGSQLYSRRSPISDKISVPDDERFLSAMLVALFVPLPLTAGPNERNKTPLLLNRHSVLHGESLTYDSRLNSCRAISWIAYVGWALHELRSENQIAAQKGLKPAVGDGPKNLSPS